MNDESADAKKATTVAISAKSLERDLVLDRFAELFHPLSGHSELSVDRSADRARTDSIHSNATRQQLSRKRPRQRSERGFACRIGRRPRHTDVAEECRVEDDCRTWREQWQSLLRREVRPTAVRIHHLVIQSFRGRLQWRQLGDPGVGKQDVDASNFLLDAGEQSVEVGHHRHVDLHSEGIVAEFVPSSRERLLVPAGDDNRRALAHELFRGREPDSAASARDNDDLICKPFHALLASFVLKWRADPATGRHHWQIHYLGTIAQLK